jgi:transcription initiation factor TFIID subunit 2
VFYFREPVDPVALNIPDYYKIIPKKDARDLKTIRSKLDGDKYDSVDAFEADIQLMAQNAATFNGVESPVTQAGFRLRDKVVELLEPLRIGPSPKKRKDENDVNGASKRAKLS